MERRPEPEAMDLAEEADAYAEADFDDVNQAFVERLAELAHAEPARRRALDLGTGPGEIPMRVACMRPHWRQVAIDMAAAMLALAAGAVAASDAPAPLLLRGDCKRIPFASASFDVVYSNSILHHVDDVATFWGEVRRVTRAGGLVFVRDLARPDNPEAAAAMVSAYAGDESALLREEFYRSLLAAYTVAEVRAQLNAAGLAELHVEQVTDRHLDVFGVLTG